MAPMISLEHVSLQLPIRARTASARDVGQGVFRRLFHTYRIGGLNTNWLSVLDDLSLTARVGDRIGLVGANGAGKTTLLKVLAGSYVPQTGHVRIVGNTRLILQPGTGLFAEGTGYENILLRGLSLGYPLNAIKAARPEIAEFSGLDASLSRPVRTYSQGMRARLAFAISTAIPCDILLLDEWLGAGDREFRKSASERMKKFVEKSGIVVIASHNERLLRSSCNRLIELQQGRVISEERL
jgi:ABC-type polysaccharide/polyol phosphate transport system ATPase subunit